jgi:tetratricopeptide (TPR) repeat protein
MYNLGNIDKAKEYYNDALKINPNLSSILSEKELTIFNKLMNNNHNNIN